MAKMLKFNRYFTRPGHDVLGQAERKKIAIKGFDGPIEAPMRWSQTAVEVAAQKYFRKRGVGPHAGSETSVFQLLHRVVESIARAGAWQGYFNDSATEQAFKDELSHILLHQMGSFNSPVYFNVGIFPEYQIAGHGENYYFDRTSEKVLELNTAYVHPQASACFIQSVKDDLVSIFDLLKSEAKLFKYGSGTGTNFSSLRAKGEPLEGGGESTGLISYLEIFDKAAQAIKSGGTTRRAAKMVVVDADHPEILEFIRWKMDEERKARVLMAAGFSGGMDGEAFRSVSGQNSNNSVRVTDEFMKRVRENGDWQLRARRGGHVTATIPAAQLWQEIARAAWECADPGLQFHDTIQRWHFCPRSGPIRASNPCSEFMFLDDSACNLASINLVKFMGPDGFDWKAFAQTVRILLIAQDILVDYASYPTADIARNSHHFRPLGLGYANLGGLLMRLGIPYESEEAILWTQKITAGLHALALEVSQDLAEAFGPFAGWDLNRAAGLEVIDRHFQAWRKTRQSVPLIDETFQSVLKRAPNTGFRNAQVTLIAPTGTIGLFMDCDTLGIEPEFSLVKTKTLAGGGALRMQNRALHESLLRLGYTGSEIAEIERYVSEKGTVAGAPQFKREHLKIFDTAIAPKDCPERRVTAMGHLKIMAAAQPFLSGAISKTVNLPQSTTIEEIKSVYEQAWQMGLKSVAVYRDGSKSVQPLCAEC